MATQNSVGNSLVGSTGSGSFAGSVSPSFTTPALGTPSAGILSSCSGLSLTSGVSGVLPVANGGTNLSSTTANQILYSSGTNTIAGLSTANNSVLVTSAGGVPSISSTLPLNVQNNITALSSITSTYLLLGGGTSKISVGSQLTNISGLSNTAFGNSMFEGTGNGASNTGIGYLGLNALTNGSNNFAVGAGVLKNITTGNYNVAIGSGASGGYASSESSNISLNNASASAGDSHVLRIGDGTGTGNQQLNKSFIHGIRSITTVNNDAVAVLIDSAGQLGTTSSSIRYKENIETITEEVCSEIQRLRPVQFNYKGHPDDHVEYGLIAEEVIDVFPDAVVYNGDNQPETIQYHKFCALMIAEIQRLNSKIVQINKVVDRL